MKHVAITGASSGIGAALVEEYVAAGAAVTLVARRRAEMEALAARVGGRTQIFVADLSDLSHCCDWLAPAAAQFGPIDILINNAGVQRVLPAAEHGPEDLDAMLNLNLLAPLRLTRSVLPAMLARQQGTIVEISSTAAYAPMPGMWGYIASKAGSGTASEGLGIELADTGVHVLTVYPGPVDTPLARTGYAAYPDWAQKLLLTGDPRELARRIRAGVDLKQRVLVYPLPYALCRSFPGITRAVLRLIAPLIRSGKTPPAPGSAPSL
jgi:short-subunit dehydrogenase